MQRIADQASSDPHRPFRPRTRPSGCIGDRGLFGQCGRWSVALNRAAQCVDSLPLSLEMPPTAALLRPRNQMPSGRARNKPDWIKARVRESFQYRNTASQVRSFFSAAKRSA
jgi:hypothetical protein